MAQNTAERPSKASSRYSLPGWFLERNVKTVFDLKGFEAQVPVCQCETCVKCKDSYDDIDSEDESPKSESTSESTKESTSESTKESTTDSTTDAPKPEDEPHTSAEKHETTQEDAISYAKFSELRDAVASNMLWRRMRPQDATVLLRRCSVGECSTCSMEPVLMNDIVTQVAASLGMGLISLNYEDLERLGSDFHNQDKRQEVCKTEKQTAEKESVEKPKEASTTDTTTGDSTTTKDSADKCSKCSNCGKCEEKVTKEEPKEETKTETDSDAATPKEPVKDDWKADFSDGATFTEHFFAARSKKWQDEDSFSYSAWRERAKQSYSAVLDGVSAKSDQTSKPKDGQQAEKDAAPAQRGLMVHVVDCDYANKTLDYRKNRRVLVRLGDLIQERRGEGEDIVLVVSSRNLDVGYKRCRKLGVSSVSSVELSIVNPSQKSADARALRRKGTLNTRRLSWILEAGMADTANTRPEIEWLKNATGDDLSRYGQDVWAIDDVHRAAGQILTRAWIKSQSVITSKHVDSALKRLDLLKITKESEKTTETSGDAETKTDEVVEEVEVDPLENLILDDYEEKFRNCVVNKKDLKVKWDDVILDQDTKEVVQNLVPSSKIEVEASSEFLLAQLRIRGCMLYGPPGTGKTHLCRAIAASSGSNMLSIDYAATQSMWVGETEKYIRGAFSLAAKLNPCVLLIDEADALFYRRSSSNASWERGATTQFLVEMEGLGQNANAPLVVVATNRPWEIDEAFLRRLPQKFYIGLPDQDSRAAILRLFLKSDDLDPAVDIDGMAAATKGFSGSDLRSLCAEAALIWKMEQGRLDALCGAVSPAFAAARKQPKRLRLDVDHFAAAFEKMQPSNAKESAEELERFHRRYNPVQGELGSGNGGKRYVLNEDSQRNEACTVRDLISRDVPAVEEKTPDNVQLVVWRDPDEVLRPGKAKVQPSEVVSPPAVATCEGEKKSEKEVQAFAAYCLLRVCLRIKDEPTQASAGEGSEDHERGETEPKAQKSEGEKSSEAVSQTGADEQSKKHEGGETELKAQSEGVKGSEAVTQPCADEQSEDDKKGETEPKAQQSEEVKSSDAATQTCAGEQSENNEGGDTEEPKAQHDQEVKSSDAATQTSAVEQPAEDKSDTEESKAQNIEAVPYSEFDIEKAHATPERQDLRLEDTPPSTPGGETTRESDRPQSTTGPDTLRTGPPLPEPQKLKTGADVDLLPLLVTFASVFWYLDGTGNRGS